MPIGDCCGYRVFWKTDDGEYRELNAIVPVRFHMDTDVMYQDLSFDTDCSIQMTISHQAKRKLYRMIRAQVNRQRRMRRRVIRNTEWARRMELKRGVKEHG